MITDRVPVELLKRIIARPRRAGLWFSDDYQLAVVVRKRIGCVRRFAYVTEIAIQK